MSAEAWLRPWAGRGDTEGSGAVTALLGGGLSGGGRVPRKPGLCRGEGRLNGVGAAHPPGGAQGVRCAAALPWLRWPGLGELSPRVRRPCPPQATSSMSRHAGATPLQRWVFPAPPGQPRALQRAGRRAQGHQPPPERRPRLQRHLRQPRGPRGPHARLLVLQVLPQHRRPDHRGPQVRGGQGQSRQLRHGFHAGRPLPPAGDQDRDRQGQGSREAMAPPRLFWVWLLLAGTRGEKDGDMRLANGDSANEGRVEIFYRGQWGTVCDNLWDLMDASVVCRALGFQNATEALGRAAFGPETRSTHTLDLSGELSDALGQIFDSQRGCDLFLQVTGQEEGLCAHTLILTANPEAQALWAEPGSNVTLTVDPECVPVVRAFISHEALFRSKTLQALEFHTVPLRLLAQYRGLNLTDDAYAPRIYTSATWSASVTAGSWNTWDRSLSYQPERRSFPGYVVSRRPYGSRQYPSRSFQTPQHPSFLFRARLVSWSLAYLPSVQRCWDYGLSCSSDELPVLGLTESGYADPTVGYDNKALMLCGGRFVADVVDFRGSKAAVPSALSTNSSRGVSPFPCPAGSFSSFLAVIRPFYLTNATGQL
uniref:Galectin 3 binding protein n=1 Tax=Oryctolagus cuniculus TaxID=9986 RepID=A0A5F9DBH7_RABIT